MHPYIHIVTRDVSLYGLMAAVGVIVALFVCEALAKKRSLPAYDFLFGMIVMALFAVVGAKLLFALTNADYLAQVFDQRQSYADTGEFLQALAVGFSGMVFYGGALGAIAGMAVWVRITQRNPKDYFDLLAVGIPLFHFFARIGCFAAGCCYGIESDWGFVFHESEMPGANGVVRFPVQFVEAGCEAVLCVLIINLFQRKRFYGNLIWVWLGSYAVIRFLDEFIRGDLYRGFLGSLSSSQWISIAILMVVAVYALQRRNVRARSAG